MPFAELEIDAFLSPLGETEPCGTDLEYDDAFRELLEAGEDKPETEYGDRVYPAKPPDWLVVRDRALALATRTRDLRVAVWLARSGARRSGLAGFVEGLALVRGLLERYWPAVHPRLDPTEGDDPTARLNALSALADPRAGLADLRAAGLTGRRGAPRVRDVELAFTKAEPLAGEAAPTRDGIAQAVVAEEAEVAGAADTLLAGQAALAGIAGALEQHLGPHAVPDFSALKVVLDALAEAADAARRTAPGAPGADDTAASASRVGPIASREDAIRALEEVCAWLEHHDASNPAPLLIRRAQRLMRKGFLDIIRDLAPDTLGQIEKLAGIEPT